MRSAEPATTSDALLVVDLDTGTTRNLTAGFEPTILAAAWIVGHEDRFRAAVVVAGVSDYVSRYGTGDVNHGVATRWEVTTLPVDDLGLFVRSSPLTHLSHASTPTLILHGEEDARVPVGQAWETWRMLRDADVETELVLYPGAGHGISDPEHFTDVVRRWIGWYRRWLAEPAAG